MSLEAVDHIVSIFTNALMPSPQGRIYFLLLCPLFPLTTTLLFALQPRDASHLITAGYGNPHQTAASLCGTSSLHRWDPWSFSLLLITQYQVFSYSSSKRYTAGCFGLERAPLSTIQVEQGVLTVSTLPVSVTLQFPNHCLHSNPTASMTGSQST